MGGVTYSERGNGALEIWPMSSKFKGKSALDLLRLGNSVAK